MQLSGRLKVDTRNKVYRLNALPLSLGGEQTGVGLLLLTLQRVLRAMRRAAEEEARMKVIWQEL
jgi:hypothetical protein